MKKDPDAKEPLTVRIRRRLHSESENLSDRAKVWWVKLKSEPWPCRDQKFVVVGCESSGTTIISHLLLNTGDLRFLLEGQQTWVWEALQRIYRGESTIREYPKLQLYDAWKVPGFAAILPQIVDSFPNIRIVYVVRDPRDVVESAFRTWKVKDRAGLANIPWVSSTWLGIEAQDPIVRLASRWRRYMEISRALSNIEYLRYEDFCQNKVACILDLSKRLGIQVNEDIVRARCDLQASSRVTRDYAPKGIETWKNGVLTEEDLRLIEETCSDEMQAWGYLQCGI